MQMLDKLNCNHLTFINKLEIHEVYTSATIYDS